MRLKDLDLFFEFSAPDFMPTFLGVSLSLDTGVRIAMANAVVCMQLIFSRLKIIKIKTKQAYCRLKGKRIRCWKMVIKKKKNSCLSPSRPLSLLSKTASERTLFNVCKIKIPSIQCRPPFVTSPLQSLCVRRF